MVFDIASTIDAVSLAIVVACDVISDLMSVAIAGKAVVTWLALGRGNRTALLAVIPLASI